ncbi:D-alanine--poly(phosphoribitol) ligase subunit DltC [Schleiferilactobacillus shenzhenensis]|uniref:D-alanyl carrier protein n=1 Tax=Schleiferilactobacillus shenzhenensis LY-73 TaxID=1231336 RepID=U4TKR9_9LACO|nr:D-alanine--poly(phosphoribitol) ligase subunit DltC [Schleiferilactobacillus shenzhenensis]ERL65441.1 DltC [Schleiferilactobacillus shenzhenensis LY-73]
MAVKDTVLDILSDLTGSDEVKENLDTDLFKSGLLDSMGTVQLLLELQSQLGVNVPVSEFDRTQWDTPNKIIAKVEQMQQQ